jgi:transposase
MDINNLHSLYRRWKNKQSIQEMSLAEGFDRKTIRGYLHKFNNHPDLCSKKLPAERLNELLFELLPANKRSSPVRDEFSNHLQEIINLLTDKDEPVKPKTAYTIIKQKYKLTGSYESFKVFARKTDLVKTIIKQFPRLETLPGQEVQIDYCTVGYHVDPETGKNRRVYAFIGKLSASRLPYIEFTYSQKQDSFVMSNVHMLEFFEGVPEYLTIDNLKSGVIKPHIYDPQLNRAYAEFAEYYDTFINPCIAGHSKGKAKVERQVKEVRELYRALHAIHPTFSLQELNQEALTWCTDDYGMTEHGTTHVEPWIAFLEEEKNALKPLAVKRFEVPIWKSAKVHPDQFISFEKKRYSLPYEHRNKTVHCRKSGPLLALYDENYLFIRQYVISSRRAQWTTGDFPESFEAMMMGEYPQYLIRQAARYGIAAKKLAETILKPHAFLNARLVKGVLSVLEEYQDALYLDTVCAYAAEKRIFTPKILRQIFEEKKTQQLMEFMVPISSAGAAMVRDITEYLN